ncbi:MAG: hypothetical protein AAF623_16310, partial [Planctomycetota bacterium]
MRNYLKKIVFTLLFILLCAAHTQAQDDKKSELGILQREIERRMTDLENSFTVVAEKLRTENPVQHKLLVEAYQQSKEKLITRKLAEVGELLDQGKFEQAYAVKQEVYANIIELYRRLLQQKEKVATKEEEMKQLQRWRDKIKEQIKDQSKQRKQTEKIANKEETVRRLEAQIKQLKGLIDDQKKLIDETDKNSESGLRKLDKIADQQFEIRKKTDELKNEIGQAVESRQSQPGAAPKDKGNGDSDVPKAESDSESKD